MEGVSVVYQIKHPALLVLEMTVSVAGVMHISMERDVVAQYSDAVGTVIVATMMTGVLAEKSMLV